MAVDTSKPTDERGKGARMLNRPAEPLNIYPFLALARELSALLLPIRPRAQFRVDLHRSLVASAQRQQAQMLMTLTAQDGAAPPALPQQQVEKYAARLERELGQGSIRWVVGAAAVGSAVSLAGILAYLVRRRSRPTGSTYRRSG
jgi:hypothetical protein